MITEVVIDGNSLTLEQVTAVARDRAPVSLAPQARQRAGRAREIVDEIVARGVVAYGVTTGFGKLSDEDLGTMFAYLRTVPPVKHRVDNTEPPTYCRICRHKHGGGSQN